ncbi:pseudoazurin [Sphingomonas faeni]|uniref:pseudoazurin n=1 Tax=Sphingomonas faeni TaxID=185950 RepID=UPI0020C782BC|nr:pseudoazurin [Sphingomonas faeni]MCP8891011.1 pseudoazurin [Sphingomonas faeni]
MRRVSAVPILALAITCATAGAPAAAKDVIVHMRNQGAAGVMVFEPAFVKVMPGDTVRFLPTDPSHNAETIPTMLPAGVTTSKGQINKEFALTVSTPGLYGIECRPHYAMGMVALIQVGNGPSANLAAARAAKLPPFAARRMAPLLAMAK